MVRDGFARSRVSPRVEVDGVAVAQFIDGALSDSPLATWVVDTIGRTGPVFLRRRKGTAVKPFDTPVFCE